ncbi:class I SAM-dependent methyltransferase [Pseudonocardia hydrocarbonoxydans]|uniref:Methyltransferase type 11 domain-containing protein n=1 Tax=Pseudonocardia hydrocarbonoxydans TaxID=76726 RepID=A0A4Y3WJD4_9PSEU|nr:class I SAM-dependent methyltransferase [Pseudonocardia hydrocarbonoxydans]GEC19047.1 hypothetical protein PHY01_13300 [Pseudonocardia hydrocarbonoxydans]
MHILDALHGGDVRGWAEAPVRHLDPVVLPRVVDGRLHADPVGRGGAGAVVLLLALHRVIDVDAAFAELRYVLRPGGTLVVVTPSVAVRSVAELRWRGALRPVHRGPWRHRAALDDAGWLLSAADFAVLADDRLPLTLPLPDSAAARRAVDALPAAGLWPDLTPDVRDGLAAALTRRAGPGSRLPVPLRRFVARR